MHRPGWIRVPRGAARLAALCAATGAAGCDLFTDANDARPGAQLSTAELLPEVRAQFARALGAVVIVSDNVSDNYALTGLDDPRSITPDEAHVNATGPEGIYVQLQRLRALADSVIDVVVPVDTEATRDARAELHYYRGMAYLMQAENFVAVPDAPDSLPRTMFRMLELACIDFSGAWNLWSDTTSLMALATRAASARAYRWEGNVRIADLYARTVLELGPTFAFVQAYDGAVANAPHDYLVARPGPGAMQPLPRLDFLDPKYTTPQAGIPVAKAEEMHLILAEIGLFEPGEDVAAGRNHLADALELARARERATYSDGDMRRNPDQTIRPRHGNMLVRADATAPYRAGLVQSRPGAIMTPVVSGTSLDPDSIRALTAVESLRHAFWLARQELFFLEGRRMGDLRIRLPVARREVDGNPAVIDSHFGTRVVVPEWIPELDGLDRFDPPSPYAPTADPANVTPVTDRVTVLVDMNRRLVENRASPFEAP
jgi:hypothetical protein